MSPEHILDSLRRDGVAVLGRALLSPQTLTRMQRAYAEHIEHLQFNGTTGYHASDPYRRIVHDILPLDAGFVELVTHPIIQDVVERYVGRDAILTEAKAWRSQPTTRSFHGWHNDAWYDPALDAVPPQLKLGLYLSDVDSGAFTYLPGTHGAHRPTHWSEEEATAWPVDPMCVKGQAGTAFLFDASGIHRQACPLLEQRDAAFFVYHDPAVALQPEDRAACRYHPVLLRASHLGGLTQAQCRLLGVGNDALERHNGCYAPAPDNHWSRLHHRYLEVMSVARRVQSRLQRWAPRALPSLKT